MALSLTREGGDPGRHACLPMRVRIVDEVVGAAAEALARHDAEIARAQGRPVQINLDELVTRAELDVISAGRRT